ALVTFVAKGLSELYDPRVQGGVRIRDGIVPAAPAGSAPTVPPAGSEIARVTDIARKLVAAPDFRGLTPLQRSRIANWDTWNARGGSNPVSTVSTDRSAFSVVEKTVEQLQDA